MFQNKLFTGDLLSTSFLLLLFGPLPPILNFDSSTDIWAATWALFLINEISTSKFLQTNIFLNWRYIHIQLMVVRQTLVQADNNRISTRVQLCWYTWLFQPWAVFSKYYFVLCDNRKGRFGITQKDKSLWLYLISSSYYLWCDQLSLIGMGLLVCLLFPTSALRPKP